MIPVNFLAFTHFTVNSDMIINFHFSNFYSIQLMIYHLDVKTVNGY